MLHKEGNIRKCYMRKSSCYTRESCPIFPKDSRGDYMILRNSSPIPKEPRNQCLKIEPPAEILLRALKIYSVMESESDYKGLYSTNASIAS